MPLRVRLFGGCEAVIHDQSINLRTDKIRGLLAYLLLEGRQERRANLTALLWPDYAPHLARSNLRTSLSRLRKAICSADKKLDSRLFTTSREFIQINSDGDDACIECDVIRFRKLLDACDSHPHDNLTTCVTCRQRMTAAAELYQGDLLAGLLLSDAAPFDEWLLVERESLHQQALTLLNILADACYAQGDYPQADNYTRRILALEPWQEKSHFRLMQILVAQGQWGAAAKQYEQCQEVLQRELGTTVSPETTALHQTILDRSLPIGTIHRSELAGVPTVEQFFGRRSELGQISRWLGQERRRVISLLGIGGVGKTTLAAQSARSHASRFAQVLWRSLINSPPLDDLLHRWIESLAHPWLPTLPDHLDDQIDLLLSLLRDKPVLLVLDNLESLLQAGEASGKFLPESAGYESLLQRLAETKHQATLLITSREQPRVLARLARRYSHVESLLVDGLSADEGSQILARWDVRGSRDALHRIVERYSGNPLALELVAETIDELYQGEAAGYLAAQPFFFEDIRDVLDQQFGRLSRLEQQLLYWLAVERIPRTLAQLHARLVGGESEQATLAALRRLLRRALVEQQQSEEGHAFSLQNVINEYVTGRIISLAVQEVVDERANLLESHGLLLAQSWADVRASQRSLLVQPVVDRLLARWGADGLTARLTGLVDTLRRKGSQGYAAGNVLTILLYANVDITGLDLSGLTLRQVNLQNTRLPQVNLSGAHFVDCRFTDTFAGVTSSALHPDDSLLAVGGDFGELRLWRRADYHQVARLRASTGRLWSVAFHPDGDLLAAASGDGNIYLWQVERRKDEFRIRPLAPLGSDQRTLRSLAFHPGGREMVSAGEDGSICLWRRTESGMWKMQQRLVSGGDRIFRVIYSPDGRLLAWAGADTSVHVWDREQARVLWKLAGHRERIAGLTFTPDNRRLVSGGVDSEIRVWNVEAGRCEQTLRRNSEPLLSVAVSLDGRLLAGAGRSHEICLWDTSTWQPRHTLQVATSHPNPYVWNLLFDQTGQELVSAGESIPIQVWSTSRQVCKHLLRNWTAEQSDAIFHPAGGWLLVSSNDGHIYRLMLSQVPQPRLVHGSAHFLGTGRFLAMDPLARWLAAATIDGRIRIWSLDPTGDEWELHLHQELNDVPQGLGRLRASGDGRLLAASTEWGELYVWNREPGHYFHLLRRMAANRQGVWGVAIHPGEQVIATGGDDGALRFWDASSGARLGEVPGLSPRILCLDYCPDGRYLAVGSADGSVAIWQTDRAAISHRFVALGHEVTALCFVTPDTLACASSAGAISLWRLEDNGSISSLGHLSGHGSWINQLQVHPQQPILASVSDGGSVRLWDWQKGEEVGIWRAPGPYAGANIHNVRGITEAQRENLLALGAVDRVARAR